MGHGASTGMETGRKVIFRNQVSKYPADDNDKIKAGIEWQRSQIRLPDDGPGKTTACKFDHLFAVVDDCQRQSVRHQVLRDAKHAADKECPLSCTCFQKSQNEPCRGFLVRGEIIKSLADVRVL